MHKFAEAVARLRPMRLAIGVAAAASLSACATAPVTQSGMLARYDGMQETQGVLTKGKIIVDRERLKAARTMRILPTRVTEEARAVGLKPEQIDLLSNAMERSLCFAAGQRYEVVPASQPADLTVQAFITHIGTTNVTAAATSNVVGIAGRVAGAVTGVPVPTPRLPFGLGGLSVEAEALDAKRATIAAMSWARGADSLTVKARASEDGDAFELAREFGGDFGKLLTTGSDPLKAGAVSLPSARDVSTFFGGAPAQAVCEQYGRNPGVANSVGGMLGMPPSWTDSGPAKLRNGD